MENFPAADVEVRTYFARGRNALVARAEFSELYAGLYLHEMDCGVRLEPAHDQLLRDALAAITLHCASRPRSETAAWTVNFQSPLVNVFVSGDNPAGTVVGNVFTENVKQAAKNLFYADGIEDGRPARRGVVDFEGADFLAAVEQLYERSEQRLARFFRYADEDIVMISAQPDCDEDWLALLDDEAIVSLDRDVELSLLEKRHYRFECGCNPHRLLAMVASITRGRPGGLFQNSESLRVHCPRCGARHVLSRKALDVFLSTQDCSEDTSHA